MAWGLPFIFTTYIAVNEVRNITQNNKNLAKT
jgi:hypothetical protein